MVAAGSDRIEGRGACHAADDLYGWTQEIAMTAIKSGDPVLNTMRFKGIPVTRKNYLNLCYMGKPPLDSDGQLHPEAEQELPDELRGPDDVIGQSNPI